MMLNNILIGLATGWPSAVWSLPNEITDFDTDLVWSDERPKPTLQEVMGAFGAWNQPSLNEQLETAFLAILPNHIGQPYLTGELMIQIGTLKQAITDFNKLGQYAVAKTMIEALTLPQEMEDDKQALLALFPVVGG